MTAPLTPADCDLQDFPFMPLHVARLRDSDLAAEAHPEACWYAVMLWSAAWHQLPAGSLPDNEAVLARLCGLGRDLKTFRKHRADAMRGFVLCDDGRLYHPVVCEQVNAAWAEKLAYRERKARRHEIAVKAAEARWGTDDADASGMHEAPDADASSTGDAMPKGRGTGTGTISSEDKSSGAIRAVVDHDKTAWEAAVILLTEHGGINEKQARSYFGKLLATNGLEPRDLLPAITAAMVKGSQDPQGYLNAAATGIAKRRTPAVAQRVGFV